MKIDIETLPQYAVEMAKLATNAEPVRDIVQQVFERVRKYAEAGYTSTAMQWLTPQVNKANLETAAEVIEAEGFSVEIIEANALCGVEFDNPGQSLLTLSIDWNMATKAYLKCR